MRSFRVQQPWSKNIHRGILLTGKWVTHEQRRNVCARDRRAYTSMNSSNTNKWTKSFEQRQEGAKKLFYYYRRNKRGGVKVCVCRHFLRITSGASRVCRHSYQRVCQHMSALPDPQHVCPMRGERFSCLYFPQKKEKYKISHDVTMNPSWTHLCQKALLQPSLSLPHFLFHLSLLHTPASQILHWAPFLFHISVFFNISPLWSMSLLFFFLSPLPSLLILKNTSSFYSGKHHLIESPKCTTVCQKCQDVLIIINFV